VSIRLHHIGYAVADAARYLETFLVPLLGPLEIGRTYEDPIQKVRVRFVTVPPGSLIELVEPLEEESPVSRVIGSPRGGVYHICYEVDDLESEIRRFRQRRCLPLGTPVPAVAFAGRRIIFLMTPQHDLIELVEAVAPDAA
jgi:methylmalonyl-CoA/ethylmalonyl-CoA epimerase